MRINKTKQKIFGYILALLIFIFIAKIFQTEWQSIKGISFSFNCFYLFLAFIFGILNLTLLAGLWYLILKKIDTSVSLKPINVLNIFIKSWLGRYLPGKIWMSAGKVYLGAQEGIDKKILSISVFFELVLSTLGHMLIAILFSLFLFSHIVASEYVFGGLIIFVLITFFILNKKTLLFILKPLVRLKNIEINKNDFLSTLKIVYLSLLYSIQAVTVALVVVFLYLSLFEFDFLTVIYILGSFVVANFIARISFIAPAGLGVREGAWMAILVNYVSLPVAGLISIVSRLLLIFVDLVFYIAVLIAKRYKALG